VLDGRGYFFFPSGNSIRFLSPGGRLGTFSGATAIAGYTNGDRGTARFNAPGSIIVDPSGDFLIADTSNHVVRKINRLTGEVSTFAGSGVKGFRNGTVAEALLNSPQGLTCDSSGAVYVTDTANHMVRRISGGTVTTFAGSGVAGWADGSGTLAQFNEPAGITIDPLNYVYVSELAGNRVRKISPSGIVTTIAGTNVFGLQNGVGSTALLNRPSALAFGLDGRIYFTEEGSHTVRSLTPSGYVMTLTGNGVAGYADGTNTEAVLRRPFGIACAFDGSLIISDSGNERLRRLSFKEPAREPRFGELRMQLKPALTLFGEIGQMYRIEGSPSVEQPVWTTISHVKLTNEMQMWLEVQASDAFNIYRALLE
jgi:sugar lactone lactonase YvrE